MALRVCLCVSVCVGLRVCVHERVMIGALTWVPAMLPNQNPSTLLDAWASLCLQYGVYIGRDGAEPPLCPLGDLTSPPPTPHCP